MLKTKNISKWFGYEFKPVGYRTGIDYSNFVRNLRTELNAQLESGDCEIIILNKGYFYVSGFVYSRTADRYVYFNTGDVRDKHWYERGKSNRRTIKSVGCAEVAEHFGKNGRGNTYD